MESLRVLSYELSVKTLENVGYFTLEQKAESMFRLAMERNGGRSN